MRENLAAICKVHKNKSVVIRWDKYWNLGILHFSDRSTLDEDTEVQIHLFEELRSEMVFLFEVSRQPSKTSMEFYNF